MWRRSAGPRRVMGTLRRAATIRDWYWSARMQAHAIEPGAVALIEPGRKLHIKELDIDLTPHSHEFFLKGLKAAKLLANEGGARFSVDADSRIRIEIDGIRAFVESYQDLLILNEIFLAGVYNVTTPEPVIVIDIG